MHTPLNLEGAEGNVDRRVQRPNQTFEETQVERVPFTTMGVLEGEVVILDLWTEFWTQGKLFYEDMPNAKLGVSLTLMVSDEDTVFN
jgi:hypothetical protein